MQRVLIRSMDRLQAVMTVLEVTGLWMCTGLYLVNLVIHFVDLLNFSYFRGTSITITIYIFTMYISFIQIHVTRESTEVLKCQSVKNVIQEKYQT